MSLLRSREVVVASVAAVLGVGSVFVLGALGWPGTPFDCAANPCYCELPREGLVRQLGNTWSNLAAVVAGLVVAVHAAQGRLARTRPHAALDLFGLLAPPALVFQGVGSMYFHGGLTTWGSALDAMSMFAIAGLLVTMQALRLGWLTARGVLGTWLSVLVLGLAVGFVSPAVVAAGVFALFLTILSTEVLLTRRGRTSTSSLFRVGITAHVSAVGVWFFSAGEGLPLCAPHSVWQGHGLWHLLTAVSVSLSVLHVMRNLGAAPSIETAPVELGAMPAS